MTVPKNYLAQIKVIGVGGAGGNAINRMKTSGLKGVEFISINTDAQVLLSSEADQKICIGAELTNGLGAGGNPEIGKLAAEESVAEIEEALSGADMIFITVGEGGGTGTGAAPVIAQIGKKLGLTVAVASRPFEFEGQKRHQIAEQGLRALRDEVDALIVIPNERLAMAFNTDISFEEAFAEADQILMESVQGVTDLITRPGIVNTDFADVKAILGDAGSALIGVGEAYGEDRGINAAKKAIMNPLLEETMQSARGIILNVTAGNNPDLKLSELTEAAEIVRTVAHEDANIIFGAVKDDSLGEKMRVTVISAGFAAHADEPWQDSGGGEILDSLKTQPAITSGEDDDDIELPDFLK